MKCVVQLPGRLRERRRLDNGVRQDARTKEAELFGNPYHEVDARAGFMKEAVNLHIMLALELL